ncbi:serotransferrin [Molossus molossus]|uniref:Serotransferrin n=3 Tax=Molossus molossus TaxID=27622 RepID=A0A7J8DDV5_MOLMO|nr:serotransferrin [Molossus molossus]KAF6421357.1 transferrin [Molossus molossus]
MRFTAPALLACTILGLCLAVPENTVRWCTTSTPEFTKCTTFRDSMRKVLSAAGPLVECVKRTSYLECIKAIAANEADAVTLDAGLVYEAGLAPYNLKPVVAENYGSKDNPQTSYYAVAVVKKGSGFQLNELRGKKSCHTGLGRSAGWKVPMGLLYKELTEPHDSLQKAASNFFEASCVPCADRTAFPKLCQLCAGKGTDKCACSNHEPYFGYSGALKCLMDGAGDVAFVKHLTVLENMADQAKRDQYELLCGDNTRKPVDRYDECHLAIVPSHAVVARSVGGKEDLIWELLNQAQEHFGRDKSTEFQLFGSSHGKDLLFKDSTQGLLKVPPRMDSWMYLGYEYVTAIQNLKKETGSDTPQEKCKNVKWCAIGHHERTKCDEWSVNSGGKIECESAESTEDCIAKIMKGEADAMSLDGGFIYIAGKCGLVPVLAENYKTSDNCENTPEKGYLAVAVVKSSSPEDLTWNTLQGKKSCHTAVDRTAGWNIPMGLLYNRINHCEFDKFFSQGCAPGYERSSSLCALCIGSASNPEKRCEPNSNERYYGYTGAFRCLVESGDVAFVKDQTVLQNTEGNNPDNWAKDLKRDNFKLLCTDGTRKPVTEAEQCHLARAPNHGVVSRKDKADCVRQVLHDQQGHFGKNASACLGDFCLFQSKTKDLLFRDDTKCLANLQPETTYESYLGAEYVTAVANLKQCSTSKLLEACTFHKAVRPKVGP